MNMHHVEAAKHQWAVLLCLVDGFLYVLLSLFSFGSLVDEWLST
jgi:hypothetical protein